MNTLSTVIFLMSPRWNLAALQILNLADHGYYYYRPASRFVADFIGTANVIEVDAHPPREAEYHDHRFAVDETNLTGKVYASIRPESIVLAGEKSVSSFSLPATVKYNAFLGEKSRYFLTDDYGKGWTVDQYDSRMEFSDQVFMIVKSGHVHLIDH